MTSPAGKVFLVGMMGVGKTTTGRLLAEILGWPLFDSDEEIAQVAGKPLPDLFHEQGEAGFRQLESVVISELAGMPGSAVVALGGGAVLLQGTRDVIKSAGLVVWLRAKPDILASRVGDGEGRPLLKGRPDQVLKHLSEVRAPIYEGVSRLAFDVDKQNPREVALQIADAVKRQPCVS